jgi:hypothetical protein
LSEFQRNYNSIMKLSFKLTEKSRSKKERGPSELKTSFYVSLLLLYQEIAAFNLLAPIAKTQPSTIDTITKTNGLDASIFMNAPP